MLDRLALRVFVSVGRSGDVVAEDIGVERPARVDMRLTEIRVALRCALRQGRASEQRYGCACNRRNCVQSCENRSRHDPHSRVLSFQITRLFMVAQYSATSQWLRIP